MIVKRFLKSCRYDPQLLMTSIIMLLAVVVLAVGVYIYGIQKRQIIQLNARIQDFQENQRKKNAQVNKVINTALKLDGVFQDNGIMYAVFNGHLFKEGDRVANRYDVKEISRYKVSVKDTTNGETVPFTLINPSSVQKSH